ncbi:MAG: DUF3857 domain-containing protein [Flavobacteriaceae bacterium]|nr:DUF3857 domain-containing protein [Flavobacteriaceae bacterium]
MKNLTISFWLLFPIVMLSQNFDNEDFIFLKRHNHFNINLVDGEFNIIKSVTEQGKFLTSKKLYFANEVLSFNSFSTIKDIKAFTYLPLENKKINVDYIETKHTFENGVFYSDQQTKNFTFPAVKAGAETHLEYQEIISDPRFLGLFQFGSFVPTLSTKLSIEFPDNISIGYKTFHTKNFPIEFKKEHKLNRIVYTWTLNNIDGFQGEEQSESLLYYLPHIILHIKSYDKNGDITSVLNDVKDLYKWYDSLVNNITENNLKKVHDIAENISNGYTDKHDKAEAIFNWVQDNITYVAFEDGLGGFIPRSSSSVVEKRYGDCKDMANLLYEMLNHVDIESYRAWIGTRDRPYSYREVPTPMVDNHMITAAVIDNDTIFLDATDSYVSYGLPSSFIQNKEALIGIDNKNFNIRRIPVPKMKENKTETYSEISINSNLVHVNETRSLIGFEKVSYISDFTFNKNDKTREEYLNTTLKLGNNKTMYSNISERNFDNKSSPLLLSYDLKIDNYLKKVANKTYINMNIDRTLSRSKIDLKNRKYSKKIDHKYEKAYTTRLIVPEGFKVSNIPEDLSYEHPKFGFDISYVKNDDQITQHKVIYINALRIDNNEFEIWNNFIKNITRAYKKNIILEQLK